MLSVCWKVADELATISQPEVAGKMGWSQPARSAFISGLSTSLNYFHNWPVLLIRNEIFVVASSPKRKGGKLDILNFTARLIRTTWWVRINPAAWLSVGSSNLGWIYTATFYTRLYSGRFGGKLSLFTHLANVSLPSLTLPVSCLRVASLQAVVWLYGCTSTLSMQFSCIFNRILRGLEFGFGRLSLLVENPALEDGLERAQHPKPL